MPARRLLKIVSCLHRFPICSPMSKPPPKPVVPAAERRTGVDRRHVDGTPPGKHERRRGIEARKPEVLELDMSNSEWAALSGDAVVPAAPKKRA